MNLLTQFYLVHEISSTQNNYEIYVSATSRSDVTHTKPRQSHASFQSKTVDTTLENRYTSSASPNIK